MFLLAYNGPEAIDTWTATIAAVCALGVAFCPTNCEFDFDGVCSKVYLADSALRNGLHYSFASVLISSFAFFSLLLFPRTPKGVRAVGQKKRRNAVYYVCGWLIVFSLFSIALSNFTPVFRWLGLDKFKQWTFVFETLALSAFGFSWLTKGQSIFPDSDRKKAHRATIVQAFRADS
jgi:hypothetical protein